MSLSNKWITPEKRVLATFLSSQLVGSTGDNLDSCLAFEFETSLGPGTLCCKTCTWTHLSSRCKIQRNYMGLKITVWMHLWGKFWTEKYKDKKPNCHFWRAGRKAGYCTQHHRGVGKPPKPHLQPDPCIHLTPDKEKACHLRWGASQGTCYLFSLIPAASKGATPIKP